MNNRTEILLHRNNCSPRTKKVLSILWDKSLIHYPLWSNLDRKTIVLYYWMRAQSMSLKEWSGWVNLQCFLGAKAYLQTPFVIYFKKEIKLAKTRLKRRKASFEQYILKDEQHLAKFARQKKRDKKPHMDQLFTLRLKEDKKTLEEIEARLKTEFCGLNEESSKGYYKRGIKYSTKFIAKWNSGKLDKVFLKDFEAIFRGPGWLKHKNLLVNTWNRWMWR